MAKLLWRWPRPQLTLRAEGQTISCEALYIAMGHYFAGPWTFAPDATRTVPDLHIVALKKARRRDFLSFMLAMVRGKSGQPHPNRMLVQTTSCTITGPDGCPVQIDGDEGLTVPLQLEVAADAVRVV